MNASFDVTLSLPDWAQEFTSQAPHHFETLESRMRFVLDLTAKNIHEKTGGPFGAAIFDLSSGRLISVGVNRVMSEGCSVAHAEMMAIMLAQKTLGTFDLSQKGKYQLVTSAKMCIMCFGGVIWSGLLEVVYSAEGSDVESIVGFDEGPCPENYKHELEKRGIHLIGPLFQDQGIHVLKMYVKEGGFVYNSSINLKSSARRHGVNINKTS